MEFKKLWSPITINGLEIRNRFVVPPMGTNYANADGTVSQKMIDYYAARAKGGFGLIIVEVTAVNPLGKAIICESGLWDDSQIESNKKLVDAVHAYGAKIFVQLHHCGRQTSPYYIDGKQPVAPSPVACPLMDTIPKELTTEEVWKAVDEFGDAALRAKKAGYDGVEVHGAHGYLIAQFMSPHANKRIDEFGGNFENRMRFPLEIFKNIRKKCGRDYPMDFRYSYDEKVNGGRTLEESTVIARLAEEAGVDALNISIMTYGSLQWMSAPSAVPSGFNQYATERIKQAVSIPVFSVGRYNNIHIAEDVLLSGKADMICFGRESLADPEIPNKVREGRLDEISPCIACLQSCLGYLFNPAKNTVSCLVNPVTGHEGEYDFSPAKIKKNVAVIGAGPAGLSAALNAARRGHKVTVYEKADRVGGQYRIAAIPPTKHEILMMLTYYEKACRKLNVEFKFNTEAGEKLVENLKADAVVLATGGVPFRPNIDGICNDKFVTVPEILDGKVAPGRKVLVVGGGMAGAETSDFLAEHNRAVTVIDLLPEIAQDTESGIKVFLMQRLREHNVEMITSAKVTKFYDDGIDYIKNGEKVALRGFETIVLAMGVKSYNPLEEKLKGRVKELYVIGDAGKIGQANCATEAGLAVGLKL